MEKSNKDTHAIVNCERVQIYSIFISCPNNLLKKNGGGGGGGPVHTHHFLEKKDQKLGFFISQNAENKPMLLWNYSSKFNLCLVNLLGSSPIPNSGLRRRDFAACNFLSKFFTLSDFQDPQHT